MYQGESSDLTFPRISTTFAGNTVGKAERFRRVSDSTESPNVLATVVRSSPRSLASVPTPYPVNTHTKSFGKRFCQIIPRVLEVTRMVGRLILVVEGNREFLNSSTQRQQGDVRGLGLGVERAEV